MPGKSKLVLPFNSQAVNKARPIAERITEYSIEGVRGLRIRVFPSVGDAPPTGVYTYRYTVGFGANREQRRLKIGRRDAMSLHDARKKVEDLRREVESGVDVARVAKERRDGLTFRQLADRCLADDNESIKDSTKISYKVALAADAFAAIGKKIAQEVTPDDIAAITRGIAKRGSKVQADRTRTAIGAIFKYGRAERLVTNTPAAGLAKCGPKVARDRVLSDAELLTFWNGIHSDEAPLSTATRRIMVLALLTGQRRSEVAGARVDELDLDGPLPIWTISGDRNVRGKLVRGRTKSSRTHVVRLSWQAADVFRKASAEDGVADYVFPADDSKRNKGKSPRAQHIHGESVSKALRRARSSDAMNSDDADVNMSDVTVHDLRRTMATFLGNKAVHPVVLDIILDHVGQGVTRKHYDHSLMAEQVRDAMQLWADHLWKLTGQPPTPPS